MKFKKKQYKQNKRINLKWVNKKVSSQLNNKFKNLKGWILEQEKLLNVGGYYFIKKHPESENLYCEKIDMGNEIREIASGLQKFVKIEDMTGLVLVLSNLGAVL